MDAGTKDYVKVEGKETGLKNYFYKIPLAFLLLGLASIIALVGVWLFFTYKNESIDWLASLGPEFYFFVLGGFIAQMIDGSLGMAYGASASAFLMSFGVSPAAASASIHTAEIFTTGISGLSHLKFQNVNKKLFKNLLIPGVIGAAAGAYILSSFEDYNFIVKPVVSCYTLILGVIIVRKALIIRKGKQKTKNIPALAAFGGFMDSVGGGGWGPIVTSTLIAKGRSPRYTIGSVNLAEFFISLTSSLTFFATIGISYLNIIAGLILGGAIAAPMAASLTRKLPVNKIMIIVGAVIIIVSFRSILKALL